MPTLSGLTTLTELDAVNTMLAALGEAPLTTINTPREDVALAVNLLRSAAVEVQTEGWKFNTEFGFELGPAGSLVWPGTTTTLWAYVPPADLLAFEVTRTPEQQELDLVIRPPVYYPAPLVFYDRAANRDGLELDTLKIDPVWLWEFNELPQSARRYITILATRRFCEQALGAPDRVVYSQRDELMARRALEREHGTRDKVNMFHSVEDARLLGHRRRFGTRIDWR